MALKTDVSKLMDARVNPTFRRKALAVVSDLESHGVNFKILEVIRTAERQRMLYAQGRRDKTLLNQGFSQDEIARYRAAGYTAGKGIVTSTAVSKYHGKGLAMDIGVFDSNGKYIGDASHEGYVKYGSSCKAHGLTWGGGWKLRDAGHCQLEPTSQ